MPKTLHYKSVSNDGISVFIAVPAYSGLSAAFTFSLFKSQELLLKEGIECDLEILTENCHIDDGRNLLVRDFLESGCDMLVFIDTDVEWEAKDLVKLIKHDVDIVAGLYPLKKDSLDFPVRVVGDVYYDGELVAVDGVPTGFLKITKEVLLKLEDKSESFIGLEEENKREIPIIFERILSNGTRWSGDYTFCNKAKELGYKIYIDPEMEFSHHGEKAWKGRYGDFIRCLNKVDNPRIIGNINLLAEKKATSEIFVELYKDWANIFAASPALLMSCYEISQQMKGNILECGSGLSTIILGLSGNKIISLENDFIWYKKIQHYLNQFGLDNVNLIYAPIKEYNGFSWFDMKDIPDINFEVALVDAPCREIGRKGFYELFNTESMMLIVDDSETEAHYVDGRDNVSVVNGNRPFIISKPMRKAA